MRGARAPLAQRASAQLGGGEAPLQLPRGPPVLLLRGICNALTKLDPHATRTPFPARRFLNNNQLTGTIPAALGSLTNVINL